MSVNHCPVNTLHRTRRRRLLVIRRPSALKRAVESLADAPRVQCPGSKRTRPDKKHMPIELVMCHKTHTRQLKTVLEFACKMTTHSRLVASAKTASTHECVFIMLKLKKYIFTLICVQKPTHQTHTQRTYTDIHQHIIGAVSWKRRFRG